MQRRNFLKNIFPMAAVPFFSNQLVASVISPSQFSPETLSMVAADINRVLVLVRLHGGNDGLATVVPMDQYGKLIDPKVRKDLMVAENKLLKINGNMQGLHPSMTEMYNLFNDGKLTIVQGVANSANVFSHFHGIDQWESASDNSNTYSSGWMGRYIAKTYSNAPVGYPNSCMFDPFAIEVGASPSLVLTGTNGAFGQTVSSDFNGSLTQLQEVYNDADLSQHMKDELAFLRTEQGYTNDYGRKIVNAWQSGNNTTVTYPNSVVITPNSRQQPPTTLGQQLKIVARLLRGGLKTRIFVVNIGNFDTHESQGSETGVHAWLLKDLSNAIGAFQKDLEASGLADRVMGMTYSEFGRRVQQNNAGSTEHGLGAPMFIFGNKASGRVIGTNYEVNVNTITASTNVEMQYDYRQVYKSILTDWLSVCSADSLDILKKEVTPLSNVFKTGTQLPTISCGALVEPNRNGCTVAVKEVSGNDHDLYARVQPNPNNGQFVVVPVVGFDFLQPTTVLITDVQGRQLYRNQVRINEGENMPIATELSNGMYIVTLKNARRVLNLKIVVQH